MVRDRRVLFAHSLRFASCGVSCAGLPRTTYSNGVRVLRCCSRSSRLSIGTDLNRFQWRFAVSGLGKLVPFQRYVRGANSAVTMVIAVTPSRGGPSCAALVSNQS